MGHIPCLNRKTNTWLPTPVPQPLCCGEVTRPSGSVVVPPITILCVSSRMTLFAKSNQVFSVMSSTLREWELVMYLLGRNVASFLQALLTQWMGSSVAITDSFPCSSVPTVYSRVSVVLLVAFVLKFFVFLTKSTVS